jgi:hypothetical protein
MYKAKIYFSLLLLACMACTDNSSLSPATATACDFENLKGDVLIAPTDSCRTAPWPPQPIIGFQEVNPDYTYFINSVNPENEFQIAFIKYTNNLFPRTQSELWVMDLCTQEKRYISNELLGGVDWSIKGWMVFTRKDLQLWKVKSSGDSLTQLTFEGVNSSPSWNWDGSKILYRQPSDPGAVLITLDEKGKELSRTDTTYGFSSVFWTQNEKYALAYLFPHTYLLDLETLDTTRIDIAGRTGTGLYWTTAKGIYRTDLLTQTTDTLATHQCNNLFYRGLQLTDDEKFAFFRATIKNPVDLPNLYTDHKIYWIDLQTGEIREVLMD